MKHQDGSAAWALHQRRAPSEAGVVDNPAHKVMGAALLGTEDIHVRCTRPDEQ